MSPSNHSDKADNKQRTLTVIVPVFNRSGVLENCLESIYAQLHRPIELILVDNASKDESLEVCRRFQLKRQGEDFSIIVLQESKQGACAARNKGLYNASGAYLLFFDSDDRMYPDCCSTMIREAISQDYPPVIACKADIDTQGKRFVFPKHSHAQASAQLYDPVIKTASCIIRRDFLEQTGPWDEDLQRWQDLEFGFRLLLKAPQINWILRPLFCSHVLDDSITAASYTQDHLKMNQSLDSIRKSIDKQDPLEQLSLLKALAFKTTSMAALLYREKSFDLAESYYQEGLSICPSRSGRLILRLHYRYTRLGGRGFWRLAEKIR